MRDLARSYLVFATLCLGQLCQAAFANKSDQNFYLSQSAFGFGDMSPTGIAFIGIVAIVGLLILAWFIRRSIRRSRLYRLRAERHGVSGLDRSGSGSKLFARSRPDKTELVRTIVIGSEHDVDVRFDREGVSTRHAEMLVLRQVDSSPLMPLEPIYYIRDMASARGVEILRGGDWVQFRADVVLDDEQLRIGGVETTAGEINQLAIQAKLATPATAESS